jgi:hypothetical protein
MTYWDEMAHLDNSDTPPTTLGRLSAIASELQRIAVSLQH